MSIRQLLTRKALVALDEVMEQARAGPVAPSFAIRFVLAYLYATGKGERAMHDRFWRAMHRAEDVDAEGRTRWDALMAAFHYIQMNAGVTVTAERTESYREERMRAAPAEAARRRMTAAIRDEAALRRAAAEAVRQGKDCGWL